MPADGVKGKTWGPSSVHQRSRGHLPLPALARPRHAARFSSSAPDLPPAPPHAGNAPAPPPPPPPPSGKRKPRKSKSQVRPSKHELARKRTGSHDDLLYENDEPRRNRTFLLCPMFTSAADLPHQYDAVFDLDKTKRKGSHGDVKKNLLRSLRSNSLTGLFAVAGSLTSETTELLRDD